MSWQCSPTPRMPPIDGPLETLGFATPDFPTASTLRSVAAVSQSDTSSQWLDSGAAKHALDAIPFSFAFAAITKTLQFVARKLELEHAKHAPLKLVEEYEGELKKIEKSIKSLNKIMKAQVQDDLSESSEPIVSRSSANEEPIKSIAQLQHLQTQLERSLAIVRTELEDDGYTNRTVALAGHKAMQQVQEVIAQILTLKADFRTSQTAYLSVGGSRNRSEQENRAAILQKQKATEITSSQLPPVDEHGVTSSNTRGMAAF